MNPKLIGVALEDIAFKGDNAHGMGNTHIVGGVGEQGQRFASNLRERLNNLEAAQMAARASCETVATVGPDSLQRTELYQLESIGRQNNLGGLSR